MPSVWRRRQSQRARGQRLLSDGSSLSFEIGRACRRRDAASASPASSQPPDAVRHLPSERALPLAAASDQTVDGNRGDDEHPTDDHLTVERYAADYKTV